MRLGEVVLSDKHYDLLEDNSTVIFCEGVTNSGKSLILGIKFFQKILSAPKDQKQFLMAGVSVGVLEKMYIQNDASFYNMFGPLCDYKKSGQAGSRIIVNTPTGVKYIYLVGYDNSKRWRDILGLTLNGSLVEEINQANDDFVDELILRTFRNNGFLYCSSNGADPDIRVYTEYLDKGRPLEQYSDEVPDSTWECLDKTQPDKDYRYYFFTFDDNPTMSDAEVLKLSSQFGPGSWKYLTKILGERGIREGAIFADYMSEADNMVLWDDIMLDNFRSPYPFIKYTLGIDVGAEDYTVFTLNGFTQGFEHQVVIDYVKINHAGTDEIWDVFNKFYEPYHTMLGNRMYGALIDYGGGGSIVKLSIARRMKSVFNMDIANAYKLTIRERCDIGIKLLHQNRIIFTDRTKDIYKAFTKAFYTKDKEKTDCREFKSHTNKDYVDAVEYGQSPFTKHMITKI